MLYVVRHGKTGWDDKKMTMGCMDIPLCDEGIKEAEILRDKLKDTNLDLIITSPLTRTRETAYIINEKNNAEVIIENKLVERNMGNLEFRNYPDYNENERIWSLEENTSDYFVEPMQDFKDRVFKCMDKIVEKYQDKDVLIVTHGGVTALIKCYFTNKLDDEPITNKFLKNGEIEEYDMKKNKTLKLEMQKKE